MFEPARIEVPAGTSIVWTNRDDAPHTATAADTAARSQFDTGVVKKDARSKPVKFAKPGEYAYICDLHPFMKATVVVR
jgi:plastocyanin